jgi:hypothetical protein
MHNGSLATFEDVVDHYSRNFNRHPNIDFRVMPLNFTTSPKAALVAFTGTAARCHSRANRPDQTTDTVRTGGSMQGRQKRFGERARST